MDGHRFHALSKIWAGRASRRTALARLGWGGLAAGDLGIATARRAAAATQATPGGGCALPIELAVRQGPNAGVAWRGEIKAQVDAIGALTGVYTARRDAAGAKVVKVTPVPTTRKTADLPVVGQVNGHSISLLITVADGQHIYGVGVLEQPISACGGAMGGPFVGPDPAEFGSWATCGYATCRAVGGTANFCSGVGLAYFCAEPR